MSVFVLSVTKIIVYVFVLSLILQIVFSTQEIIESNTKHSFQLQLEDFPVSCAGVGVRWKNFGPIRAKVYSAGLYLNRAAMVSKRQRMGEAIDPEKLIRLAVEDDLDKSIILQMAREVSAETMISALSESIKPRIGNDNESLNKFRMILSNGLDGGRVTNKMVFRFDGSGKGSLHVQINGMSKGIINSRPLIRALFGTYLDSDPVSPSLRENVLKNLTKW